MSPLGGILAQARHEQHALAIQQDTAFLHSSCHDLLSSEKFVQIATSSTCQHSDQGWGIASLDQDAEELKLLTQALTKRFKSQVIDPEPIELSSDTASLAVLPADAVPEAARSQFSQTAAVPALP